MISFAFTIYKFFEFEKQNDPRALQGKFSPRDYAISMAAIGVVSLILAIFQYRKGTRQLKLQMPGSPYSLAEVVAVLISFFGLFVLIDAIVRR
jgi:uncharacterized membrane protein YidH (DUF202 family)